MAGKIAWVDLTVDAAEDVRDFYAAVVGWQPDAVPQRDYDDYNMTVDGEPQSGICHRRDGNGDMPAAWMIYITVDDLDASLASVQALGGRVVVAARGDVGTRFAVIADPAGAVCALYEEGAASGE